MNIREYTSKIFSMIKSNWFMPITEHQVYSNEEIKIGVWTDGKPLYRKVFVADATLLPMQWVVTTVPVGDVEKIINAVGYTSNGTAACAVSVSCDHDTFEINYCGAQNQQIPINAFMLEYTKTTDTIETTKVPFEPLAEYSTGEKMIGYWIDGKPIYRTVIVLTNAKTGIVPNTWTNLVQTTIPIDTLIKGNISSGDKASPADCSWFGVSYSAANKNIRILHSRNGNTNLGAGAMVILEYTKTTD